MYATKYGVYRYGLCNVFMYTLSSRGAALKNEYLDCRNETVLLKNMNIEKIELRSYSLWLRLRRYLIQLKSSDIQEIGQVIID